MGQIYRSKTPPKLEYLEFYFDPCNPKCINWKTFDNKTNDAGVSYSQDFTYSDFDKGYEGYIVKLDEKTSSISSYVKKQAGLRDLSVNGHHMVRTTYNIQAEGTEQGSIDETVDTTNDFTSHNDDTPTVRREKTPPFLAPVGPQKYSLKYEPQSMIETQNSVITVISSMVNSIYNGGFGSAGFSDVSGRGFYPNYSSGQIWDNYETQTLYTASGAGGITRFPVEHPLWEVDKKWAFLPKGNDGGGIYPLEIFYANHACGGTRNSNPIARLEWGTTSSTVENRNYSMGNVADNEEDKTQEVDETGSAYFQETRNFQNNSIFQGMTSKRLKGGKQSGDDPVYDTDDTHFTLSPMTGMNIPFTYDNRSKGWYKHWQEPNIGGYNPRTFFWPLYDKEIGPVLFESPDNDRYSSDRFNIEVIRPLKQASYNDPVYLDYAGGAEYDSPFSLGEGHSPELPLQPIGDCTVLTVTYESTATIRSTWRAAQPAGAGGTARLFGQATYTNNADTNWTSGGISEKVTQGKFAVLGNTYQEALFDGEIDYGTTSSEAYSHSKGWNEETIYLNPSDFSFDDTSTGYYVYVYDSEGEMVRMFSRGVLGKKFPTPKTNSDRANLGDGSHVYSSWNLLYTNPKYTYMDHVDATQEFTLLIYKELDIEYPPVKTKNHTFPGRIMLPMNNFTVSADAAVGSGTSQSAFPYSYDKLTFSTWFKELDPFVFPRLNESNVNQFTGTTTPGPWEPNYALNGAKFTDSNGYGLWDPITSSYSDADEARNPILSNEYFEVGIWGTGQIYIYFKIQLRDGWYASDTDFGQSGGTDGSTWSPVLLCKGPKISRGGDYKWHHIAVSLDFGREDSYVKLYIDGNLEHTFNRLTNVSNTSFNVGCDTSEGCSIGAYTTRRTRWFIGAEGGIPANNLSGNGLRGEIDGQLDYSKEFERVFPACLGATMLYKYTALSASEIKQIYSSQKPKYVPENQNYESPIDSMVDDNNLVGKGTGTVQGFAFTSPDSVTIQPLSGAHRPVYTATVNLANASFALENIYNSSKFYINSSTGVLTLIENPPAIEPRIGLYTVNIVASKAGEDDITKTVTVVVDGAENVAGEGAVTGGGGQGDGPEVTEPYQLVVDALDDISDSLDGTSNDISTIVQALQEDVTFDDSAGISHNPRVFAVVGRGDSAESLTSNNVGSTHLTAPGFWKAYFDNEIGLKTLSGFTDGTFNGLPYLGYVAYSGTTLLGVIFVCFPANVPDRLQQPGTLSEMFTANGNLNSSTIWSYSSTTSFVNRSFGIISKVHDTNTSSVESPNVYTQSNAGLNSWIFSGNSKPNSKGYYSATKFSNDDGVWGVILDGFYAGNSQTIWTSQSNGNIDQDDLYGVANFNASDNPGGNFTNGDERWGTRNDQNIRLYCFV